MSVIRILSETVASQIAAGEVVDRPSSVVRELVDNSIDAGADRIAIFLEGGGRRRIRVSDNGAGMGRDDLLLCVERHATSKIENAADLLSVKTLGFRGEALPSIASVSRTRITSRPKDQLGGYTLKISGGRLESLEEAGSPAGTIVEVDSLFFNTPARRKFLRTPETEAAHVLLTVSVRALPFAGIAFRLEDPKGILLDVPASGGDLPRLAAVMGRETARAMAEGEHKVEDLSIRLFLASPEWSRDRGDRLYLYVNGRHIRDRLLTRAVLEGYGQRLMKGRYPQAVVFLEMPPADVDVNVHPAKQEVRFGNARAVFQALAAAVGSTLVTHVRSVPDFVRAQPGSQLWHMPKKALGPAAAESAGERWQDRAAAPTIQGEIGMFPGEMPERQAQVIGQLGDTYILCQVRDGLLVVDQHAAHERIVYETLKRAMMKSGLEVQAFLVPPQLELGAVEARLALQQLDRLKAYGIALEHFGGNTFLLRAVPAMLGDVPWDSVVSELVSGLDDTGGAAELLDRALKVMACHGSVRARQRLSREGAARLVEQLSEMHLPTNCPHGRPIFRRITYGELERMFKRVV